MNDSPYLRSRFTIDQRLGVAGVSLFAIFAVLMSSWAIRLSLAEIEHDRSQRVLSRWQQQGYVSENADAFALIDAQAANMLALYSDSTRYWMTLSKINEWRAYQARFDRRAAAAAYRQALDAAIRALQLQPANATIWASVSRAAFYSQGANATTELAIAKAVKLGLWQLSVQRDLAVFGIRNWRFLSPDAQQHIRHLVRAAMRSDTTRQDEPIDHLVIAVAFANDWLHELLPLASRDIQRRRISALLTS